MTTLLYTHPACLEHDPGPYHPESPDRLRAILEALEAPEFARLERRAAPEAAIEDLVRVHPRASVERLLAAVPETGRRGLRAMPAYSTARRTSIRSIPAPARRARPGSATSSTCRCGRCRGRQSSALR